MTNDQRIALLKDLVDIDRHTDTIKNEMQLINKGIAKIADEMKIIGAIYLDVLIKIKNDD
jgi:hypothetical protein